MNKLILFLLLARGRDRLEIYDYLRDRATAHLILLLARGRDRLETFGLLRLGFQ